MIVMIIYRVWHSCICPTCMLYNLFYIARPNITDSSSLSKSTEVLRSGHVVISHGFSMVWTWRTPETPEFLRNFMGFYYDLPIYHYFVVIVQGDSWVI